ncbi:hypothetical protein V1507DRAFT_48923 [Lipomyces tetrasporus]
MLLLRCSASEILVLRMAWLVVFVRAGQAVRSNNVGIALRTRITCIGWSGIVLTFVGLFGRLEPWKSLIKIANVIQ